MKSCAISCQVHDLSDKITTDIQFTIDSPVPDQEVSGTLSLRGWVVHRTLNISRLTVESATKKIIAEAAVDIHRPGVSERFRDYRNPEKAGFMMEFDTPPVGVYSIVANSDSGQCIPISSLNIRKYTQRKLLFMHIAKAGGSTVNKFLARHYSKNKIATHIESNEQWFQDPDYLQSLYFISGHVNLQRLNRYLELEDYYKITVLREPYSHVISHLAWIRKLSDQGEDERLQQHPDYVQRFSQQLLQTNLSEPAEIRRLIGSLNDRERRLVDNCQVRYFTGIKPGECVTTEHVSMAIKASKIFDRIGTTEALHQFFKDINQDMGWQEQKINMAENVSDNYYGMARSDTDICVALHPLVKHDIALYEFILSVRTN